MTQTLTQLSELAQALSPHLTLLYSALDPTAEGKRSEQERSMAQSLVRAHLGQALEIAHHPHGAPYILQMPSLGLSISHCEDLLVIVLAPEGYQVGIDIERRSPQVGQVLPRMCSPMELTELGTYPQDATLKASLLWGAKEAVYKAISPQAVSLRSLHLLQLRQEGTDSYSLDIAAKETQTIYRVDCLALPKHVLSLVCLSSQR